MPTEAATALAQPKMNRRGFGLKKEIEKDLQADYHSQVVDRIRANGNAWTQKDITFYLADSFGFCYGVDRAVELAYETRKKYPDRTLYLTTEIIHNPRVNQNLKEMGIRFLHGAYREAGDSLDSVTSDDVVIVPAFGTDMVMLNRLHEKGCELVDTLCASVLVVWKRVEAYARDGFTAIIHGKVYHEETQATSSRLSQYPKGRYLVVFNQDEAQVVCDYMVKGGDKAAFMAKFRHACSPEFDPDLDLKQVGLANQTTMLSSESLEIADMIRKAVALRDGGDLDAFRTFDTICNATQDRQNAVVELIKKNPDLMVVIGGYNSSNTSHLSELASHCFPTYHIDRAECILSSDEISHRPFGAKEDRTSRAWLPAGPVKIGMTAGASTPNQVIGEVVERILSFR